MIRLGNGGLAKLRFASVPDPRPSSAKWSFHDANAAALCAIMAEWTRTDKTAAERVANLKNGTGLNGLIVLNATTVFSDLDADVLTGSSGDDWFLFDGQRDRVTDLHDEAFLDDLPFVNG
jgi:hypothetical protein